MDRAGCHTPIGATAEFGFDLPFGHKPSPAMLMADEPIARMPLHGALLDKHRLSEAAEQVDTGRIHRKTLHQFRHLPWAMKGGRSATTYPPLAGLLVKFATRKCGGNGEMFIFVRILSRKS